MKPLSYILPGFAPQAFPLIGQHSARLSLPGRGRKHVEFVSVARQLRPLLITLILICLLVSPVFAGEGPKTCPVDSCKADPTCCAKHLKKTGSSTVIKKCELITLPVRTVDEALLLQPGVVEIRPVATAAWSTLGVAHARPGGQEPRAALPGSEPGPPRVVPIQPTRAPDFDEVAIDRGSFQWPA